MTHCDDNTDFKNMLYKTKYLLEDIRNKNSNNSVDSNDMNRYNDCVTQFNDVYKNIVLDFEKENKEKMELPKLDRVQTAAKTIGLASLTPNANNATNQANDLQNELKKRKNCFFADLTGGDFKIYSPATNLALVRNILKLNFENIVNDEKQASISDIPFLIENDEVPKGGRKRKTRQQTNRRRHRRQRKSRRHHRK